MATLSFGPLICVKLTLMGTLVVFPFPKNVQLMTSGIAGDEKVWTSFFFSPYLCVHSRVCVYITHSVDSETKREIKTHSKKGSSSLYWNVAERSEKANNPGLRWDASGGLSLL